VAEARMTAHVRAQYNDMSWVPAAPPLSGPAGVAANAPPFNQEVYVVLAAPKSPARVRIAVPGGASAVITVPAGRALQIDLQAALHVTNVGAVLLVPLDGGPVYVARTLHAHGAHGPLITTEVPLVLPAPIV